MRERSRSDMEPVLEALRRWSFAHPRSNEPFMVVRGETFTPMSFLKAVEQQRELAQPFLDYLFDEAARQHVQPKDIIEHTIRNFST